jgi:ATP-dependent exoDNAse (exonuclease V) alpha subunit
MIDCPNYVGPAFFPDEARKTWVPMVPSKFHDDSFQESRTGYAMRLAYAMTIHKSQGESLSMICVDIGIQMAN